MGHVSVLFCFPSPFSLSLSLLFSFAIILHIIHICMCVESPPFFLINTRYSLTNVWTCTMVIGRGARYSLLPSTRLLPRPGIVGWRPSLLIIVTMPFLLLKLIGGFLRAIWILVARDVIQCMQCMLWRVSLDLDCGNQAVYVYVSLFLCLCLCLFVSVSLSLSLSVSLSLSLCLSLSFCLSVCLFFSVLLCFYEWMLSWAYCVD